MKSLFFVLVALQLTFSLVLAQITFTREWVAGKRSSFPSSSNIIALQEENPACHSLWPAIAYLVEVEKLRELQCGSGPKSSTLFGKIFDSYRKSMDKNSRSDDSMSSSSSASHSHQFEEPDISMKSR